MSVFTHVSDDAMRLFLQDYSLGRFIRLEGIAQGVTNSNFFLTTEQDTFVLTLFEVLQQHEVPFFLQLKQHLSQKGIACPAPIVRNDGRLDSTLCGKPACLVSRLNGRDENRPSPTACHNTGAMLAGMHLAGQDFAHPIPVNPRHATWWQAAAQRLQAHLSHDDARLLQDEITFLAQHPDRDLPHGIIHADLFKDNVLLHQDQVAGFIDFYYACSGSFVYDLAIALNDWARTDNHQTDPITYHAFLDGYTRIRPLTDAENAYLPIARRAAAVRFWVSRLLDLHFPQEGEMTFIKDPNVFRDLLLSLRV